MNDEREFAEEVYRTKKKATWGCLTWAVILLFVPIMTFIGVFSYEMYFKEETLVISHSPNDTNTIKVGEKGQPAFFGPSSVRQKYVNIFHSRLSN